jgi:hypothetical protein
VRTTADVLAALDLGDDALRRVGRAAQERVLAEHTAERRAAELVDLLSAQSSRVDAVSRQEA